MGTIRSLVCLLCLSAFAYPATVPNFSGLYTAHEKTGKGAKASKMTMRVVQQDGTIEVARTQAGRTVTNRFPLDGTETEYVTETGVRGKGKAQLRGAELIIESMVLQPGPNGRATRIYTKEQWKLSGDRRTLSVKTEVNFPDLPHEIVAMAFPGSPWTDKYDRTDLP